MDISEYEKVKNFSYLQYCNYLQEKYGKSKYDYFKNLYDLSNNWTPERKYSRTCDGLYTHHKYEDSGYNLSVVEIAKRYPPEWQLAENLVYCNLLEHLYLHILICEESKNNKAKLGLGINGIILFFIPQLNDYYGGYVPQKQWILNCYNKVINQKNTYFALLKRMKTNLQGYPYYSEIGRASCRERVWHSV